MSDRDEDRRRLHFMVPRSSGAAGGVKTMYDHAALLRQHGLNARLVARRDAYVSHDWRVEVPVHIGSMEIQTGDVFIWSEVTSPREITQTRRDDVHHVLFVQNHFYLFQLFRKGLDINDLGLGSVVASSRACKRYLETYLGFADVPVIPYGIANCDVNFPEKVNRIATMPRKREHEAIFINHHFRRCFPGLRDIGWFEIKDLPHPDVLAELHRSRTFLSLQRLEGFGLPALEAMAAGCAVVGFTGQGGAEYASPENGIWVAEDDVEGAANALAKVAMMFRDTPDRAREMVQSGMRTAARYSLAARDAAALGFYRRILAETEIPR